MEDGTLITADPGISTIAAVGSLVLAERPEVLEFWENVRAVAHRRASLEAIVGVELWRGWTLLQFGEIGDAEESLRLAVEYEAPWALETGQGIIYTSALLARALVERDDLDGARADPPSDRNRRHRARTVRCSGCSRSAEILIAEGRFADAIGVIDAPAPVRPARRQPRLAAVALGQGAGARRSRRGRRGGRADRGRSRAGQVLGNTRPDRACAAAPRRAPRATRRCSARPSTRSADRSTGSSSPRRGSRWAVRSASTADPRRRAIRSRERSSSPIRAARP